MSWVQSIDEAAARSALQFIRELSSISLPRFRIVGDYVRYDDVIRNQLKNLKQKITNGIRACTRRQENYLIWGPPGSGKSHFARELAKSFGTAVRYIELNIADLKEKDFRESLASLEDTDRSVLCFIDEIDCKLAEQWSCEALLPCLEPRVHQKPGVCFILAGSGGSDISEMKSIIELRPKGKDLLSRIPYENEFTVPPLGIEDKIVVALSNLMVATRKLRLDLREVDKLALLYVALNPHLSEARKIGQLAVIASNRIPKGEDRLMYDNLFDPGSIERMEFWRMWQDEDLFNKFVTVEDVQEQKRIRGISGFDEPLEQVERVFGKEIEEKALICQIDFCEPFSHALEALYRIARDSNFMQNKMADFEAKRDRILYFEKQKTDQKIRSLASKLVSQTVTFIAGPPAAGKSTFLLFFLENCMQQKIGSWRRVFFINPFEDYLDRTLESRLIQKLLGKDGLSSDDALLVVDGLYRGEPDEEEKAFRLFREVREKGYRLLVTIRSHELNELKEKLGNRWAMFEGDIQTEPLEPDKETVRPVIMNLLKERKARFLRFKDLSDQELASFFAGTEFKEIVKIIGDKSGGLVGYLVYLMDDLSNIGEFSVETISKYPKGLAGLIKKIIERDFLIDSDEVLPTLVLLLAEDHAPLSRQLMEWFVKWGVAEIDRASPVDSSALESSILSRLSSLRNNFAISKKESGILVYRLNAHWTQAIKEFSSSSTEWIMRRNCLKSYLNHFYSEIQTKLARGELVPGAGDEEFVVIADVAQLSHRDEILKLAKEFLKQYVQSDADRTLKSSFLTQKLVAILLRDAQKSIDQQRDYRKALKSVEDGIEIDSGNADLNYLAGRCHRLLGEIEPQAIEHCKNALAKAPENLSYNEEMGHILESKGEILETQQDSTMAIVAFEESLQYFNHSLEIIKRLDHIERLAKRAQENRLRWYIGHCKKRITMISSKNQGWNSERKRSNIKTLLEKARVSELQGNYDDALKALEDAKSIAFRAERDIEGLVSLIDDIRQIYYQCGICYEKTNSYPNAALNYLIHADLNEYATGSVQRYVEIGEKLVEWKFYEQAHHLFHRAFRRDVRNLDALTKMAFLEDKLGRSDFALDNARKALQMGSSKTGLQNPAADLIWQSEKKLRIRDDIAGKILRIMSLSLSNEIAWNLSKKWYSAGMALDEINPQDIALPKDINKQECLDQISDELQEAKVLCFWRAWRVDQRNWKAKYEAEHMTGKPYKTLEHEYEDKYQGYLENHCRKQKDYLSPPPSWASPVTEVLLHACFRAIATERHGYRIAGGKLTDHDTERLINECSSLWGWLGGRILKLWRDRFNPIKICPSVAVRSFELSLHFNPRNRASSNNYAWALFDARKYDDSLKAFISDMKAWDPSNPKANPAAKTGVAMVYVKKGEISPALQNLMEGARLRYEFRHDEPPGDVLTQLTQTVNSLREAASVFPDHQKEILKETLRVYEMIKRVLNEIDFEPNQFEQSWLDNPNLLFLESLSLRDYLPKEYASVVEEEQRFVLSETEIGISVAKLENSPPQATEIEPKDLEMLPDRPFTNLDQLTELIKGLRGSVQLLDKDLSLEALKFLSQIDASAVKEVFILGGRSHFGTDLKDRCKAFKDEMHIRGIDAEIRVLDAKDAQEIHDRYLIADGVAYNTPPWNIIHKKLGDIKYIPNFWFKRTIFNKYWSRATDFSKVAV